MSTAKHFLDLDELPASELRSILDLASNLKADRGQKPLSGKALAMIFEKASTRTRVSFEVGMKQLGGDVVLLDGSSSQLGRGESISDTAQVLSRYVDAIMIRTDAHSKLTELAEHATVPVINGLTDRTHPCQIMADVLTFEEHRGGIAGKKVAWAGDGNNVAVSWIHAAARFDFELVVAAPEQLLPPQEAMAWAAAQGANVTVDHEVERAAEGADLVVTDVWVSMGDADAAQRHNLLKPYQVNDQVMARAKSDALFMHCLPAHREEEVTTSVIDGPQSVVFDEAENRLHAQKAILAWCLS